MTTELERIKILETKVSQVLEYVQKLTADNDRLKQLVKELKGEKKECEDQLKKLVKMDEEVKRYEAEREALRGKIEALISQIDQIGL
ncbi:MAG: cell division protein ZapB [Candidatus Aminicenantes bacterium]|nr:cell division protein ZapB [Candidatus Aminicenantes bacterium]